jgi:hypothetical protein
MAGIPNRYSAFLALLLWSVLSSSAAIAQSDVVSSSKATRLLEEERQLRLIALLALIPVVVAFSFTTFIFYRRKREAFFREKEAALRLSNAEVELKALKAQMNPHFIFNCMNSIHHYMHGNDIKKASDYLIKFSQLIRLVLENSSLRSITLEEEVQTLRLYIELEQVRLDHRFEYQIDIDPALSIPDCEMPGFLIQPFVENAIWHDLSRMNAGAKLTIRFLKHAVGEITCTVCTEGTGKNLSSYESELTQGVKKTSMGLNLVRERIELLNRTSEAKAYFITRDISEPQHDRFGHYAELRIPILE